MTDKYEGFIEVKDNYWEKDLGDEKVEFIDNRIGISSGFMDKRGAQAAMADLAKYIADDYKKKSPFYKLLSEKREKRYD